MNTNKDIYPSRGGRKAELVPRQDPVVYNHNTDECPIDEELVRLYEKQGFLILDDMLTEEEVALFQNELERLRYTI